MAAFLLVTGIRRLLLRFGLPPSVAAALAMFVLAPRFLQQGLLAIRSDVLAAGLVVWGLDFALSASEHERPATRTLAAASTCFTLAVATKVTSLYRAGRRDPGPAVGSTPQARRSASGGW